MLAAAFLTDSTSSSALLWCGVSTASISSTQEGTGLAHLLFEKDGNRFCEGIPRIAFGLLRIRVASQSACNNPPEACSRLRPHRVNVLLQPCPGASVIAFEQVVRDKAISFDFVELLAEECALFVEFFRGELQTSQYQSKLGQCFLDSVGRFVPDRL